MNRLCFALKAPKGQVFPELKFICTPLFVKPPDVIPIPGGPGPGPNPLAHLQSLATIAHLAETLPERLPMRSELRSLAKRALEAAVADLGEGVHLQADTPTSQAT